MQRGESVAVTFSPALVDIISTLQDFTSYFQSTFLFESDFRFNIYTCFRATLILQEAELWKINFNRLSKILLGDDMEDMLTIKILS